MLAAVQPAVDFTLGKRVVLTQPIRHATVYGKAHLLGR